MSRWNVGDQVQANSRSGEVARGVLNLHHPGIVTRVWDEDLGGCDVLFQGKQVDIEMFDTELEPIELRSVQPVATTIPIVPLIDKTYLDRITKLRADLQTMKEKREAQIGTENLSVPPSRFRVLVAEIDAAEKTLEALDAALAVLAPPTKIAPENPPPRKHRIIMLED